MWESTRVGKYLDYRSSLEAYLWISNMNLEDNLGLNLYTVLTTCYIVIILDNQNRVRREFSNLSQILSCMSKRII